MMISSPAAGDPYAAAAALDRALRSDNSDGGDAPASATGTRSLDAGPDVVVSLSQGASAPSTYDASGRMSGASTLDAMGANGPRSMAHATESIGGVDATSAPGATDAAGADVPANAGTADTA